MQANTNLLDRDFPVGFELEFCGCDPSSAQSVIGKDYGTCAYEYDTDGGFELQSEVFDRSDFVNITDDSYAYWLELFDNLKSCDVSVHPHVGHHIHINYNATAPTILHRIMSCLHYNHDFLSIFAGRTVCDHQEFDLMPLSQVICPTSYARPFIHCNSVKGSVRTTEFRIFASTDDVDTFLSNTQFVIAWYDFAFISENFLAMRPSKALPLFLSYVKENKSTYPQLVEFIEANSGEISQINLKEISEKACIPA